MLESQSSTILAVVSEVKGCWGNYYSSNIYHTKVFNYNATCFSVIFPLGLLCMDDMQANGER